jgi:hypothetical protein
VFSGEATNTNFIVFGLTRPGLEPMIYRTLGEHANHYTIDASLNKIISIFTIKVNIRYNIRIHQYDTLMLVSISCVYIVGSHLLVLLGAVVFVIVW